MAYERLVAVSIRYRALYRVGYTPWDQDHVSSELSALVEGSSALAPGSAIDIGCGTGTQAVYLARHGWQVTGVDAAERALNRARDRAKAAGVTVRWVAGDVIQLADLGLANGYGLIHDRGCFHDLSGRARDAYVAGVGSIAAPAATLLLMTFVPGSRRLPGVASGASEEEIHRRFGPAWEIVSVQSDSGPNPPGPMKRVPRIWYRLRRRKTSV
jgi:SAM-dependent methyltransferase